MAAFLKDLHKAKLKCPDIHLPKNKYIAMDTTQNSKYWECQACTFNENTLRDNKCFVCFTSRTHNINTQSNTTKESIIQKDNDSKDNEEIQSIRITHCSDTHEKHYQMQSLIPYGDILIHSGDFVTSCYWKNNINGKKLEEYIIKNDITSANELKKYIPSEIIDFNEWIGILPHKYKVVIAGNHECVFNDFTKEFIQKYLLTNCIYLQDSYVSLYGLKIYGTPWTTNSGMAFSFNGDWNFLYNKWRAIPSDTDILVTHLPPLGMFDLAWGHKYNNKDKCKLCGDIHEKYDHWGCDKLLGHVQQRVKPNVHLFGHVHDSVGFKLDDCGTLFVNSAMDICYKAHRVKIIFDL